MLLLRGKVLLVAYDNVAKPACILQEFSQSTSSLGISAGVLKKELPK